LYPSPPYCCPFQRSPQIISSRANFSPQPSCDPTPLPTLQRYNLFPPPPPPPCPPTPRSPGNGLPCAFPLCIFPAPAFSPLSHRFWVPCRCLVASSPTSDDHSRSRFFAAGPVSSVTGFRVDPSRPVQSLKLSISPPCKVFLTVLTFGELLYMPFPGVLC